MKREGRQHGVVRSYPILPTPLSHQRRYVKTVDSASVAGLFAKVSSKPTNHSKFTGKCSTARCLGCHIHPVSKSKDKAKGSMKLGLSVGLDREMIGGFRAGTSAIDALDYLASHESYDHGAVDDYDYNNDNVEFGINEYYVTEEQVGDGDEDEGWYLVGHFDQ